METFMMAIKVVKVSNGVTVDNEAFFQPLDVDSVWIVFRVSSSTILQKVLANLVKCE